MTTNMICRSSVMSCRVRWATLVSWGAAVEVRVSCNFCAKKGCSVRADQTITAVRFRGDSCILSRAAASILTELIQGCTLQEVIVLPQEVLLTALHTTIRPARMKCA